MWLEDGTGIMGVKHHFDFVFVPTRVSPEEESTDLGLFMKLIGRVKSWGLVG